LSFLPLVEVILLALVMPLLASSSPCREMVGLEADGCVRSRRRLSLGGRKDQQYSSEMIARTDSSKAI